MSFDIDGIIGAAVDSSEERFPRRGDPVAAKLERAFRTGARDEKVRDARDRAARGPMTIRDAPGVVLPPGVRK